MLLLLLIVVVVVVFFVVFIVMSSLTDDYFVADGRRLALLSMIPLFAEIVEKTTDFRQNVHSLTS